MRRVSKKYILLIVGVLLLVFIAGLTYSQEPKPKQKPKSEESKLGEIHKERKVLNFSDPSKPGLLKVDLFRGGITIKGYSGKEVVIEAQISSMKRVRRDREERERAREEREFAEEEEEFKHEEEFEEEEIRERRKRKTAGMKKISSAVAGFEVTEENNRIRVDVESLYQYTDLIIQVPFNTSLSLNSGIQGDINVEKVNGEIEAECVSGAITLKDISGAVVANCVSRDIVATFTDVKPGKPMSFSSVSGHIDVTLPARIKATLKMQTSQGDVYSDFDIKMERRTKKSEKDTRKKGGKYRLRLDSYLQGTINGGGTEIQFETFNGDIYIRKGK